MLRALVIGSACLAAAVAARAEAPPEITLVVAGGPASASELGEKLAGDHDLPVVLRATSLPNAAAEPAASERAAAALAAIAEARRAYVAADFDTCIAALGDPTRVPALLEEGLLQPAARTLLYRLACQVGRGATAEAEATARSFARYELPVPDDVGAIAQDAEAVLSRALRTQGVSARHAFAVDSEPRTRRVAIDGREMGCTTPCTLQLFSGEHVLSLHGDGSQPLRATVQVREGGDGAQLFQLDGASPELARRQWSARYGAAQQLESIASLRLLSRALPADKLLLLTIAPMQADTFSLHGAYVLGGELGARDGVDGVRADALEARAKQLLENLLIRGKTVAAPSPLWRNVWFWTAIGSVAVAAVVGTSLAVRPTSQRTEVRFQ